ncbi:uncharacterized protein LOC110442712 isoform X2 [Mizuhopecten yessoensis]|uniref:uncharacterized protein LOC110442712 isoform X2 n=1 Tax=Mizuhopecten yessoensis TaxID=6573 RepID=UPI000B45B1E1|nr:uncharacterized protein LOC110442712 isoform X2 [Mizuhopecten yessoensis]
MLNKEKFVERRLAIKRKLYNLLRSEAPQGVLKHEVWNVLARSSGQQVAAHFYGVSKMHGLLAKFEDMVCETEHDGKKYLQLVKGYAPSDAESSSDEDSSDSEVQIDQVSSSRPTNQMLQPGRVAGSHPGTGNILPMPVQGFGDCLLPLGPYVRQPLVFVQSVRPIQQGFQVPEPPQHKTSQHSIPKHGTDQNMDLDEKDFPSLVSPTSQKKNPSSMDSRKELLKKNLISLLKNFPQGIKKTEIWRVYKTYYHNQPGAKDYGVTKLTHVLTEFPEIVEYEKDEIPFLKLKDQAPMPTFGLSWGQGVQSHTLSQLRRERSSSTSSVESMASSSSSVQGTTQGGKHKRFRSPGREVIDLTDASQSSKNTGPFIDLTKEQADLYSKNFISCSPSERSVSMSPQQLVQPASIPVQPQRPQVMPAGPHPGGRVIDLTETSVAPISRREFEEREIKVTAIRGYDGRRQPPRDILENAARECIEILAEANQYVSLHRVEDLIKRRFNTNNINSLGIRYLENINCINEFNRSIAKVNAYIQAFVKTRSICTLYELNQCLLEYAPDKEDFASFKFGPLQRMPEVYRLFKFPTDLADIPEITSMDVLEQLRSFMTKHNKWTERLVMEEFMDHLVEAYAADNAYMLGVRLRSLPLAAMVLKKAQRDASSSRRAIHEGFKEELRQQIQQAFQKFRASILQPSGDSSLQVRQHYLLLRPETAVMEIFQKFQLITHLEQPFSKVEKRQFAQFQKAVSDFLLVVNQDTLGAKLFHLALCVSNTVLEEAACELLAPSTENQDQGDTKQDQEQKQPPKKEVVIESLKKYLERCLGHGSLKLSHMDMIEEKLADDFKFPSFVAMGLGRFLEFVTKEAKSFLDECGGMTIGMGVSGGDSDSVYRAQKSEVLEFMHQCRQCGLEQNEDLVKAICQQFSVREPKQLGYGNIGRLRTESERPGKHQSKEHTVVYESALGCNYSMTPRGQVGILGHQARETALACLHNCPLLEDLADWSQWALVFEPEHGKLKDFLQKYGGSHISNIDDGKRLMTTDVLAIETNPGKFLKLTSQTSPDVFERSLMDRNVTGVCGHLMSMVVMNRGLDNTPLALLTNHLKTALFTMQGAESSHTLPGAPPMGRSADAAVVFVLACLMKLPIRSCVTLADKVFLDPLGHVVGSTKSKSLLLGACQSVYERNRLQVLGCLLGIDEWTRQIQAKCSLPIDAIENIPTDEAQEFFGTTDQVEEDSDESDEESDDASSILSSDDEEKDKIDKESDDVVVIDEVEVVGEDTLDSQNTDSAADVTEKSEEIEGEEDHINKEEEENLTEEEKQERHCQKIIDSIRRDEFGVGVELNEDGQRLMQVHQERLGRSLDRLSKDLYSKDTHFVLELVQNADDNTYPDMMTEDVCPSVKFITRQDSVIVLNNECGFEEKNVRALCDVGKSTKGKHTFGYIGQKGIGFKSVFRVTNRPEVHSNGYHICFDAKSGPMGFILPHWNPDTWEDGNDWTTKIVLPLKEEMGSYSRSLAARFDDIHPSLLLFLHRLRKITVLNIVDNSTQVMHRRDLGESVVEIQHNEGTDRFLVIKKSLDASKISLQAKSGVEVDSTEIAMAFPLKTKGNRGFSLTAQPRQPVFAFLPLRSYGFRFIVQGDFDVPSSREDVDRDSPWNQWIRNELHTLFIEALDLFKSHKEFSTLEAITSFLQFVPMEDEILDFFRPVASQILAKLKAKACVPTQPNSKGMITWKMPSQTVIIRDSLICELITPEMLQKHLNLYYVHRDLAESLNTTLTQCLGIECLTTDHLIQIGKALILDRSQQPEDFNNQILITAKWLACVYRSLDEFHDNQTILETLSALKIIPLATYQFVALTDKTIFFPLTEDKKTLHRGDPMMVLQTDLNTIHPLLLATPDSEVNSQVEKLLNKLSVKRLMPKDVITHHILPVLSSDQWQTKQRETLISYLVYIKECHEQQNSIVDLENLSTVARLVTNQGVKNPRDDPLHFTTLYGNSINLQASFPGYDWILLDSVYLNNCKSNPDKQRWHSFLSKLGVTNFLCVRSEKVQIDNTLISSSPWAPMKEIWGDLQEGTYIQDWCCRELECIVSDNKSPTSYEVQMKMLFQLLDHAWDNQYATYVSAQLCTADGRPIKDTDSSLSILLRTNSWLPALKKELIVDGVGSVRASTNVTMLAPSDIYLRLPQIEKHLSHTVRYLDAIPSNQSSFCQFLRLKTSVDIEEVKKSLINWGARSDEVEPVVFCTSLQHIKTVYRYLLDHLPPKKTQDLLMENPVIFVPVTTFTNYNPSSSTDVAGKMMNREEVWWTDSTGLIEKHRELLEEYHSDLAKKRTLTQLYHDSDIKEFFLRVGKIVYQPSMTEYAELLVLMTSMMPAVDKTKLRDVLQLYSTIGSRLQDPNSDASQANDQDTITKRQILEGEKRELLGRLKGQKILATKKGQWISMEQNPMISDKRELEKMFSEKADVHFLDLEDPKTKDKRGRQSKPHDEEAMHVFLKLCNVCSLSESVETSEITPDFQECPKLQYYVHQAVPQIQVFIYNRYPNIYQQQTDDAIATTLPKMRFIQVSRLEVRYSLRSQPEIFHIRPEKCLSEGSTFYFHKEFLTSYQDINREISKYFSRKDEKCSRDLRTFLNSMMPILTGQSDGDLNEICEDNGVTEYLPEGEEPWCVPPPIRPVPEPQPQAVTEYAAIEVNDGRPQTEGEPRLTAWPPASDTNLADQQGRKRIPREEGSTGSNIWPPPKVPDYLRSVRELPSGVRVTDEEENSENKPERAEKSEGEQRPRDGASESGSVRQYTRQDSTGESADGMKRKRADDSQSEAGETKRPYSSGEVSEPSSDNQGVQRSTSVQSEGRGDKSSSQFRGGEGRSEDKEPGAVTSNKRRHPDDGSPPPSNKKSVMGGHFGDPAWTTVSSEYVYDELDIRKDLKLPESIVTDSGAGTEEIGQWGETLVYYYLLQMKEISSDIIQVTWKNEHKETGLPYDFEMHVATETGISVIYIEVKSTLSDKKEVFEISAPQIMFAQEQKEDFCIYRVFNAGDTEKVRLVRIHNLALCMDQKQVRLCMVI